MKAARVYEVNQTPYTHIVLFRKKGLKEYKRRFRSLTAAEAECKSFNDKLVEEGATGIHIGAKERREIEAALHTLEGTGITIAQAAEQARANWKANKGGKQIAPLLIDFLGAKEKQNSARTVNTLKSIIGLYLKHSGVKIVRDIDRKTVEEFVYSYKNKSSSRASLAAVNNFCGWLMRRDIMAANPCDRIERPGKQGVEEKLIFTPAKAWRFLRRLERHFPEYVAFYAVLLFGYLRPSEAEALASDDLRAKTIRVTQGKMRGRKRRNAPIRKNLRAWLDAYTWQVPSEAWQKKCRALSPIGWENDMCRHTGITYRLAECDDEMKTAREAGNSPEVIYAHYYELTKKKHAKEFFKIRPQKNNTDFCRD